MSKAAMPEPAAYANAENLEKYSVQLTFTEKPSHRGITFIGLVTTAQAEAYATARVREALEEAAKVCDDRANQNELAVSEDEPDEASSLRSAAWQMSVCARAIRALIPSTPA